MQGIMNSNNNIYADMNMTQTETTQGKNKKFNTLIINKRYEYCV